MPVRRRGVQGHDVRGCTETALMLPGRYGKGVIHRESRRAHGTPSPPAAARAAVAGMSVVLDVLSTPLKRFLTARLQSLLSRFIKDVNIDRAWRRASSPRAVPPARAPAPRSSPAARSHRPGHLEQRPCAAGSGAAAGRDPGARSSARRAAAAAASRPRIRGPQELLDIPLAFEFTCGYIRELRIHIPWTALLSEPVVVSIDAVEIVLRAKSQQQLRHEVQLAEAKKRSVATSVTRARPAHARRSSASAHAADAATPSLPRGADDGAEGDEDDDDDGGGGDGAAASADAEAGPSWAQALLTKILGNLSVRLTNVALRYVHGHAQVAVLFRVRTQTHARVLVLVPTHTYTHTPLSAPRTVPQRVHGRPVQGLGARLLRAAGPDSRHVQSAAAASRACVLSRTHTPTRARRPWTWTTSRCWCETRTENAPAAARRGLAHTSAAAAAASMLAPPAPRAACR